MLGSCGTTCVNFTKPALDPASPPGFSNSEFTFDVTPSSPQPNITIVAWMCNDCQGDVPCSDPTGGSVLSSDDYIITF